MSVRNHAKTICTLALALSGACVEPGELGDEPPPAEAETEAPVDRRDCALPPGAVIEDGLIVYEGDIVLGRADQLDELCATGALRGIGINAGPFGGNRWTGGVVLFEIDPQLPQQDRVHDAIAEWEAKTSIDFIEGTDWPDDVDHIRFKNHNNACNADLGREGGGEQYVRLSTGKSAGQIVGMAINSEDKVYTWYDDGMVTIGTSSNLEAHYPQYEFTPAPGRSAGDILDIAIHPTTQDVYTWYENGTYSVGDSRDLGDGTQPFDLPAAVPAAQSWRVVGIDFAPNGNVYTWYHKDGKTWRVIGTPSDLGSGAVEVDQPGSYTGSDVRGMAISSASWVYTWYDDKRVAAGTSLDLDVHAPLYDYETPGHCSTSAVIHEIGHAMGLQHEHTRCDRDEHVRAFVGNVKPGHEFNFDKHCAGNFDFGEYDHASVMHYSSHQFSKNGSPTLLRLPPAGLQEGSIKIVGSAISGDDTVYTWWSNGQVTSGTSSNLESERSRYSYALPPPLSLGGGQFYYYTPQSIVGMAIAKSTDKVYTYYANGTRTIGTTDDLDFYSGPTSFTAPLAPSLIVEIGISADDTVYAWYATGQASFGTSTNLSSGHGLYDFSHPSYAIGDLRGIDISSQDIVYAWYDDGHLTRGGSNNLSSVDGRIPFRARGLAPAPGDVLSAGDVAIIEHMY